MFSLPLNLAVLVSGSGRTLQNFLAERAAGRLNIDVGVVIGSRENLLGMQRATEAEISNFVVDRREFVDVASFSRQVFAFCDMASVDLVCLAGWLCLLDIPQRYAGRVMNIHPSLLPAFGGKGMYGHRVHEAVLNAGVSQSGCTVHFVDNSYDEGPIILQRTCPVLPGDNADTLAHRVFEEEKIAYPEAILLYQAGRLKIDGRKVITLP